MGPNKPLYPMAHPQARKDLWHRNSTLTELEPESIDLYMASHYTLKPCPFCGKKESLPKFTFNEERENYICHIFCINIGCLAQVGSGGWKTRTEARDAAIKRWQTRKENNESS